MERINDENLNKISGGDASYITGPIITAVVSVIKVIQEAGYNLGSGMRRIVEGEMCPLK